MSDRDAMFDHPLLSADAERALIVRYQAGDMAARDDLVASNMRLVLAQAHRFARRGNVLNDLDDLVQVGTLGLLTAIQRFDLARGVRLSTFAIPWIIQAIQRAVCNQHTIRLPVHVADKIQRLRHASNAFLATYGREATNAELAALCDLRESQVAAVRAGLRSQPKSLEQPLSTDADHDLTLGDTITSDDATDDTALHAARRQAVYEAWSRLTDPRERDVLAWRYGLYDGEEHTLEAIGQRLGVTRERVRQIQNSALINMRHPAVSRGLRSFLEVA